MLEQFQEKIAKIIKRFPIFSHLLQHLTLVWYTFHNQNTNTDIIVTSTLHSYFLCFHPMSVFFSRIPAKISTMSSQFFQILSVSYTFLVSMLLIVCGTGQVFCIRSLLCFACLYLFSPNSYVKILIPKGMMLTSGTFKRWSDWENSALMVEIRDFIKNTTENQLVPSVM